MFLQAYPHDGLCDSAHGDGWSHLAGCIRWDVPWLHLGVRGFGTWPSWNVYKKAQVYDGGNQDGDGAEIMTMIDNAWKKSGMPYGGKPANIETMMGGQFVVTRDRIHALGKEVFDQLLHEVSQPRTSHTGCEALEMLWPYLWSGEGTPYKGIGGCMNNNVKPNCKRFKAGCPMGTGAHDIGKNAPAGQMPAPAICVGTVNNLQC